MFTVNHIEIWHIFSSHVHSGWQIFALLQVLYPLSYDLRALLGFPVSEATLANNVNQAKIFSHTVAAAVKSQPDLYQLLLSPRRYHT